MGKFIAESTVKRMIRNDCKIKGARVGVLGLTFKENVPDLRNTRVTDIIAELREYCPAVLVHDPHADSAEAMHEYGLTLSPISDFTNLSALIVAVNHAEFTDP